MLLLTRRDVTTHVTMCTFVQLFPAEADSQVAIVTCGHEGEAETTLGLMRVQKARMAWTPISSSTKMGACGARSGDVDEGQ